MVELIINNIRVGLLEITITINKQINDLAELKDRQATYTNKFKVPKTQKNVRIFNNLGIVGNKSRMPYKVIFSKLIYNNVEVLSKGNAYISYGDKNYYHINIYDGNIFLFKQIGNKKIDELDYSDLTHELTPANYISSFNNDIGYIYAMSDNGSFSSSKIEINYQLPAIYVHTIWKKIFEATDYDYEFINFNDAKFKRLVITPKRGYNAEEDIVNNPISIDEPVAVSFEPSIQTIPSAGYGLPITYNYNVGYTLHNITNTSVLNNGLITVIDNGQYNFDIDILVTVLPAFFVGIRVQIVKNTVVVYDNYIPSHTGSTYNVLVNESFSALSGDTFSFSISIFNFGLLTEPPNTNVHFNGTFKFNNNSTSVINLLVNSFIGDLSQKAFMKSIMQHFGFVSQIKNNSNIYQFKRIQDILLDTEGASDWSEIFVSEIKESYKLKGYAKLNKAGYQYFKPNSDKFADGFLRVDNENLITEKTMFTSPFNACDVSDIKINGRIITSTPFWEENRDKEGLVINYKPIDNKNYIAELKRNNESINYGLVNGSNLNFTGYVPRLDFSNLKFQNIINENYNRLKIVLDWNNVKKIEVRLTANQVADFDFFKLVYIDKLSSHFYVNKVSYKGKSTSIVEVVKVQKLPYQCDLVANAGSYDDIPKATLSITLDGVSSFGNITTWLWEIVSQPSGGAATLSTPNNSNTILNKDKKGIYLIRLTISNARCSEVSETFITVL